MNIFLIFHIVKIHFSPQKKEISSIYTGDSKMSTFANNEDPDEMQHAATFHECLHYLLSRETIIVRFYLYILTCDPTIYTMDHS